MREDEAREEIRMMAAQRSAELDASMRRGDRIPITITPEMCMEGYLGALKAEMFSGILPRGLKSNCPSGEEPSGETTASPFDKHCFRIVESAYCACGMTEVGDLVLRVAVYFAENKGKLKGFRNGPLQASAPTRKERTLKGRAKHEVELGAMVAITHAFWLRQLKEAIARAESFYEDDLIAVS